MHGKAARSRLGPDNASELLTRDTRLGIIPLSDIHSVIMIDYPRKRLN